MAPMNILVMMFAWARPPRKCPISARDMLTSRSVMPDTPINSPASTNKGTASREKLSSAS